jgi:hypothetical protein
MATSILYDTGGRVVRDTAGNIIFTTRGYIPVDGSIINTDLEIIRTSLQFDMVPEVLYLERI